MTRTDSIQLKGIAILMMLFLHLFNTPERVALCDTYIRFPDGQPLVYVLSRVAAWCVPVYIFLSGYGLAARAERGDYGFSSAVCRLVPLYVHYWVVLLPFVAIGCWLKPQVYPGSAEELLLNMAGWSCSYNHEWWFLLPYVVLALLSPFLLYALRAHGSTASHTGWLAAAVVLYLLSDILYRLYAPWIDRCAVLNLADEVAQLFLMFLCGALSRIHHIPSRFAARAESCLGRWTRMVSVLVLLLLCVLRMSVGWVLPNPVFAYLFMLLYRVIRPCRPLPFLMAMGRQSTSLWLCHTFFAYYLFSPFVYSFRHPILIYPVLVLLSWVASVPLTRISSAISSRFTI